jgi:two-component system, chemotaxis family, chemotaxis protein CheY
MESRSSVLVVDDDEAILQLVNDSLKDTYQVATATDVLQAADLIQDQRFDLLILDLNMPVMGGEDLLDVFRVHPGFIGMPILVISAYNDLIQRLANAHVQAILPKPFAIDTLRRVVAETIANSRNPNHGDPAVPPA